MDFKLKYFLSSLGLVITLLLGAVISVPDNKLHLIFCDVGQGDAILAVKGKTQILIDGGPNDKVLGCISDHMPFWDKQIELIILTHPDADHITGLISVIERYNVDQMIANSLVPDTAVFSKFRFKVIENKIPVFSPKSGDKIKISNLELEILFPIEKQGAEIVWHPLTSLSVNKSVDTAILGTSTYTGNLNETAIVSKLEYGDFEALLTGDIGVKQEALIGIDTEKIDVLKIAHHGSKYSSSQEFLEMIRPSLAVISAGANNRYGHPTTEVLERLKTIGAMVKRTDLDGEIEIVSDGKSWGIE